jgi:potassium-transporting ATPase KdpC subunit
MKHLIAAIRLFLVLTLLTGIIYPVAVTGIARCVFPKQAHGSLIAAKGSIRGSALIAQGFSDPKYFQSRPSAIDYNPLPSGGSNLSVISTKLDSLVLDREQSFRQAHGLAPEATVPPDMLFSSGSGLDPDISPEAAALQVATIARNRGFSPAHKAALAALVEWSVERPQLGFLGEPCVNVLKLNIALDSFDGRRR